MEPGHFAIRSWIPNTQTTNTSSFRDTLTIYDAGDIQGFLIKYSTGKTSWSVFQVDYRLIQENGVIVEGCEVLHETRAPLQYFSIETFPVKVESQGGSQMSLFLPQSQILLTFSELPLFQQQQEQQQQPLVAPAPLQEQRLPPSPLPSRANAGPGSHGFQKSSSVKPIRGQPLSQNKNKVSPRSKASPSSNRDRRGPPLLQGQVKQGEHPILSTPVHHNDHESSGSPQWSSLAQQSLYSRPPPEVEAKFVGQA